MADTYTGVLRARKIEPGTRPSTWGTPLNEDVFEVFDAAICAEITIDILSATTYTLDALVDGTLGESHFYGLRFDGTPASAVTITVPASVTFKTFQVYNNTGQSLTIKYSATGGVTIKNGARQPIWCDGTTVRSITFGLGTDNTVTGDNTFSGQISSSKNGTNASPNISIGGNRPTLDFYESDAASNNGRWNIVSSVEAFFMQAISDDGTTGNAWVQVNRTGTTIDNVAFPTATAGSFLVGTSSSVEGSSVAGFLAGASLNALAAKCATAANWAAVMWNAATAGDNGFIYFGTEASLTGRGSVDYNRAGGLVRFNTSSDRRLKTNIVDSQSAGDLIDRMRVRSFDWINGGHLDHWFIAQELYEVAPFAVSKGDDGEEIEKQWAIDPGKLVPMLVKELQSLRQRVRSLELDGEARHAR